MEHGGGDLYWPTERQPTLTHDEFRKQIKPDQFYCSSA